MIPRILQFPNGQEEMETKTCCAYNVSRDRHLSPKVAVVDKADQPLTLVRLLVEGLGLKGDTSLWLAPLHATPQLVRPFPFDLLYLDKALKVVRAVELLPEIRFPEMSAEVTSALVLPLHTISATGTRAGDQLIVCAGGELEQRIEQLVSGVTPGAVHSKTDKSAHDKRAMVEPEQGSAPLPSANESVFASMTTSPVPHGVGFTVAQTTSWQIRNSTTTATVAPVGIEGEMPQAPADATSAAPGKTNDSPAERETKSESATETEHPSGAGGPEFSAVSVTTQDHPIDLDGDPDEVVPFHNAVHDSTSEEPSAELTESVPADQTGSVGTREKLQIETEPIALETRQSAVPIEIDAEVANHVPPENCPPGPHGTNLVATTNVLSVKAKATTPVPAPASARNIEPETKTPKSKNVGPPTRFTAPVRKRVPQKKKAQQVRRESEKPEEQEEQKKDNLGIRVIRWLNLEDPLPDRRTKKRYLMPGLFAYDAAAGEAKAYEVRDVGPTGLYLKTPKRWKPGQLISLTLCSDNAKERTSPSSVKIQARTIRSDKEGTVVGFVLPEGVEFDPWKRLYTKKSSETDAEYFVRELRLATAFGFLCRICEPATEQIRLALQERLSNKKLASATEIALKAQEILSQCEDAHSMIAHPHILMRILEDGSWADDDWVQHMWAGLLATSCTPDGQDTSNTIFIDLLVKMTPIHLKVLAFACRKREELGTPEESLASLTLYCSGDELVQVAGSNNLARIQQTIGHLANYGLLAESARPSYVGAMEKIKTKATPTALGLKLHARCSGQR